MSGERTWWLVPGMMYPAWILRGDIAKNIASDTDMDELSVDEFHSFFPQARDVDDLVGEWHELPDSDSRAALPLHEFLGLTEEQYDYWLTNPARDAS